MQNSTRPSTPTHKDCIIVCPGPYCEEQLACYYGRPPVIFPARKDAEDTLFIAVNRAVLAFGGWQADIWVAGDVVHPDDIKMLEKSKYMPAEILLTYEKTACKIQNGKYPKFTRFVMERSVLQWNLAEPPPGHVLHEWRTSLKRPAKSINLALLAAHTFGAQNVKILGAPHTDDHDFDGILRNKRLGRFSRQKPRWDLEDQFAEYIAQQTGMTIVRETYDQTIANMGLGFWRTANLGEQ